jgi:hypothetical protein
MRRSADPPALPTDLREPALETVRKVSGEMPQHIAPLPERWRNALAISALHCPRISGIALGRAVR